MNEETVINRPRSRLGGEKGVQSTQYTAKDFQLEVLGKLAEMEAAAVALRESLTADMETVKAQRWAKFDARTLVAIGAIVLSVTGYVIQDARNSARQDSEIEATKARVIHLEQIAATNTEGRIRTEVQLGELREGQAEIKAMIQAHDNVTKRTVTSR